MKSLTKLSYFVVFFCLLILRWILPTGPLDPWGVVDVSKLVSVILALFAIQGLGTVILHYFGSRLGAILIGFFGGIISSTATTVALAKKSSHDLHSDVSSEASSEVLTFLAATGAMLFECMAVLYFGSKNDHPELLLVFVGPMLVVIGLIVFSAKAASDQSLPPSKAQVQLGPFIKLSVFILTTLILSKALEKFFGQSGLFALTFVVSLFEVHGSLIANLQLQDAGAVGVSTLGSLLALGVCATIISKLALVFSLGSQFLKLKLSKYSAILFLSLIASWGLFLITQG